MAGPPINQGSLHIAKEEGSVFGKQLCVGKDARDHPTPFWDAHKRFIQKKLKRCKI